jgi:hypothetical protein
MNPAELRYLIYKLLIEQNQKEPALHSISLVSPDPDEPMAIDAIAPDPYSRDAEAVRTYRIQIVEV